MLFCSNCIDSGKSLFYSPILIETEDRGVFPQKIKFDPSSPPKLSRGEKLYGKANITRNINISDYNISSCRNRFYIFILRRIAKEAPGRFSSP